MASLGDVFSGINLAKSRGVVVDYAVGGAMAVLFYAEPARTYDLDVFVLLDEQAEKRLDPLGGIYEWARDQGFRVDGEHVVMHDVPVQFLPPFSPLVREAVATARVLSYEGVPVRVVAPEYLAALALQAGGARRRERAWQLLESGQVDREELRRLCARHDVKVEIPDDV
jgi:nucleotide-binding universal stress UspA family protein